MYSLAAISFCVHVPYFDLYLYLSTLRVSLRSHLLLSAVSASLNLLLSEHTGKATQNQIVFNLYKRTYIILKLLFKISALVFIDVFSIEFFFISFSCLFVFF